MAGLKKSVAFSFEVALVDQANRPQYKSNPTLATGDVKVSLDGGNYANIASLPTVVNSGKAVRVTLSTSETNHDTVAVLFSDAAGNQWDDLLVSLNPQANTLDDLSTATALASLVTTVGGLITTVTAIGTNVTTVLNRIGGFTGSGLNTILGFMRALARSDSALTPSDMGGTYDNETDALQELRDTGVSVTGTVIVASNGLDGVSISMPTAESAKSTWNWRQRMNWLFARFAHHNYFDKDAKTLTIYDVDATTVLTTQEFDQDNAFQELGAVP